MFSSFPIRTSLWSGKRSDPNWHASTSKRQPFPAVTSPTKTTTPGVAESNTIHLQIESVEAMEELGALLATILIQERHNKLPTDTYLSLTTPSDAALFNHENPYEGVSRLANSAENDDPLGCGNGGAVLCLEGSIGTGKTVFSRGFVRAAMGDDSIPVTSPTYLLCNTHTVPLPFSDDQKSGGLSQPQHLIEIHHMDLYRLSPDRPQDFMALNLPHVFANCIALIEWPSRLITSTNSNSSSNDTNSGLLPAERLDVHIALDTSMGYSISKDFTRVFPNSKIHDQGFDHDHEDGNNIEADAIRLVTLIAHGSEWEKRLRLIQDEGYLDDWLGYNQPP